MVAAAFTRPVRPARTARTVWANGRRYRVWQHGGVAYAMSLNSLFDVSGRIFVRAGDTWQGDHVLPTHDAAALERALEGAA